MDANPKLVSIFSGQDVAIAEMVRGLLEANGIKAMVVAEGTSPLNFGSHLRAAEVYVAEADSTTAVALLAAYEGDGEQTDDDAQTPAPGN